MTDSRRIVRETASLLHCHEADLVAQCQALQKDVETQRELVALLKSGNAQMERTIIGPKKLPNGITFMGAIFGQIVLTPREK